MVDTVNLTVHTLIDKLFILHCALSCVPKPHEGYTVTGQLVLFIVLYTFIPYYSVVLFLFRFVLVAIFFRALS